MQVTERLHVGIHLAQIIGRLDRLLVRPTSQRPGVPEKDGGRRTVEKDASPAPTRKTVRDLWKICCISCQSRDTGG